MDNSLTLYTNPMSRGRIARWMLEEIGEPYECVYLDYGTTMKAPDYLALNPMGKVPTLTHGERVVTEGAAVCAYLADAFPAAGLAPPIDDRADYYRWLFFAASSFEYAVLERALGTEPPEDKRATAGYSDLETVLDMMESACERHPFIAGERFSAADVYVGMQIGWGLQFGTIEKRAAFERYWARVSDRDAFRRANEIDDRALREASPPG